MSGRNSSNHTFYWHDYETWGEVPAQDRPSQFAGVRTDTDLNIIGEPFMVYCKPPQDLLPKPDACLITGITPQHALEHGLPEVEFMAQIIAELGKPGTCGVGYNSIRFDDEVTRFGLYRNFYDPYEREWKYGNSRWDIIDMARMTRALRPEGIQWPNYDDGTPCFKLEELTKANGLEHSAAHDALSDVYATIALAKLIKDAQPKLFDYAYQLRSKRFAANLIDIEGQKPVLHISSMFSSEQGNCALMLPLAYHPSNKNSVIAYNLSVSPSDLFQLSAEQLAKRLFVKKADLEEGVERIALKDIHLNKSPMLLPAKMLDDKTAARLGFNKKQCETHWHEFKNLTLMQKNQLQTKLSELYSSQSFAEKTDPEQMLYAGFFEDDDRKVMQRVKRSDPEALLTSNFNFSDKRLPELLWRYRARNFPHTLTKDEKKQWKEFCYKRLTDSSFGASMVEGAFSERVSELQKTGELSDVKQKILNDLTDYASSMLDWATK